MAQQPTEQAKKEKQQNQNNANAIVNRENWMSKEEYDCIIRRQKIDLAPIFVTDSSHFFREFDALIFEYVKVLSKHLKKEISLKTSIHESKNNKHLIYYIKNCSPQVFFDNMSSSFLNELKELSIDNPTRKNIDKELVRDGIYLIKPDLSLLGFTKFVEYEFKDLTEPTEENRIVCLTEDTQTAEGLSLDKDTNEQPKDTKNDTVKSTDSDIDTAEKTEGKKQQVTWKWKAKYENKPKFERKESTRERFVPRYERAFKKLMEYYHQDPSIPLLPMPQSVMEEMKVKLCQEQQNSTRKTNEKDNPLAPDNKATKEKNAVSTRKKRSSEETNAEFEAYLATLPPEEAERIRADKDATNRIKHRIYDKNYQDKLKAKFDAMSPEEQEEYTNARRQKFKEAYQKKVAKKKAEIKDEQTLSLEKQQKEKKLEMQRAKYRAEIDNMTEEERTAYYAHRNEVKRQYRAKAKANRTPEQEAQEKEQNRQKVEARKQQEAELLATLTPEEQEKYFEEKKATQRAQKRKSRIKQATERALEQQEQSANNTTQQQDYDEGMTR